MASRLKIYMVIAAIAALAIAVPFTSSFVILLATRALAFSILVMSLDLLLGFTGLASLGQAAYLGGGAYMTAILATKYQFGLGYDFLLVVPFGMLFGASSPAVDQERSERCTRPSIPPGSPTNTPKSVIDLIWPLTLSPFLYSRAKSSHGLGMHCFMPREMRRRSSSISRIITSTSSPTCTTFDGCTFLLVQSISETCTRPSMPDSTSTNAP